MNVYTTMFAGKNLQMTHKNPSLAGLIKKGLM